MGNAGTKFEVTENHIKLLQRMYVEWDDSGYDGAPSINLKRPYGNSYVAHDIAEIIGEPFDEDGELSGVQLENMLDIHQEMDTVLQILLVNLSIQPGIYTRSETYTNDWKYNGM
jgi:hypothetical protein